MCFWLSLLSLPDEQIQEREPSEVLRPPLVWKCDYHIVWTPKYRFADSKWFGQELVEHDIKMLCEWKNCGVIELNIQPDHIHLVVSIPPKVSVSLLMGTLKGKLAIKLFKSYPQLKKKPYWEIIFGHGGILSILLVLTKT